MLIGLNDKAVQQGMLFDPTPEPQRSAKLMATLDELNQRFGRDTLRVASAGVAKTWEMRSQEQSLYFTTQWQDLPRVH